MSFTPQSLVGILSLAPLDANGIPGGLVDCGNVSIIRQSQSETVYSRKNYRTKARGNRFTKRTALEMKLSCTFLEVNDFNNKLYYSGDTVTQTTDVRPEEVFTPATLSAGDKFWLGAFNVGTAVIKDSTATPATLVAGTDYILDATGGFIILLNTAGDFTGPLKRTVTPQASTYTTMLTAPEREFFASLDSENTFGINSPRVITNWYRVRQSPAENVDMLTENDAEFVINFEALPDENKAEDSVWGQYGCIKFF